MLQSFITVELTVCPSTLDMVVFFVFILANLDQFKLCYLLLESEYI